MPAHGELLQIDSVVAKLPKKRHQMSAALPVSGGNNFFQPMQAVGDAVSAVGRGWDTGLSEGVPRGAVCKEGKAG
jgi:hypothetical protein